MRIPDKIRAIKQQLTELRDLAIQDLPASMQPEIGHIIDQIRSSLVLLGDTVEKKLQDAERVVQMQVELGRQMGKDPLYAHLSDEEKSKIIKKIIVDPKASLIHTGQLRDYVNRNLMKLTSEELLVHAYTRDEIIALGRALKDEASDGMAYDAGYKLLLQQLHTSRGLQDAMARAQNATMKDPKRLKNALLHYYGVN